jgi:hypothetical protein
MHFNDNHNKHRLKGKIKKSEHQVFFLIEALSNILLHFLMIEEIRAAIFHIRIKSNVLSL